jgi:hypothetical protein
MSVVVYSVSLDMRMVMSGVVAFVQGCEGY